MEGLRIDDLEQQVRAFVHEQTYLPLDMALDTDVVDDAGIYGDDVWVLVDEFAKWFGVRMEGFRWYHHSGPEGCDPVNLLLKPWWRRKTHVPIRLSDLISSARTGEWCIQYPPNEAEPEETPEDRYHTRIGCTIMAGFAFFLIAVLVGIAWALR